MITSLFLLLTSLATGGTPAFAGDSIVREGVPLENQKQVLLSEVPAAEEMEELIDRFAPYAPRLSEKFRFVLNRMKAGRYSYVKVLGTSPDADVGYEAEIKSDLEVGNLSFYFWERFFTLSSQDQAKALLHSFVHVVITFPELKAWRLTDLIDRVSQGQATDADLAQLDRETADSSHRLNGEEREFNARRQFFEAHAKDAVDVVGVKILPPPQDWVHAFENAPTPFVRERVRTAFADTWILGDDKNPYVPAANAQRNAFATLQLSSTLNENVTRWLSFSGYAWQEKCQKFALPKITPSLFRMYLWTAPEKANHLSLSWSELQDKVCELQASDFPFAETLTTLAQEFRRIPVSRAAFDRYDDYFDFDAPREIVHWIHLELTEDETIAALSALGPMRMEDIGRVHVDLSACRDYEFNGMGWDWNREPAKSQREEILSHGGACLRPYLGTWTYLRDGSVQGSDGVKTVTIPRSDTADPEVRLSIRLKLNLRRAS